MGTTDHLHQRIARATSRLAQLQARELVVSQRQAVRNREAARRAESQRRKRVAELVFAAGVQDLPDGEIVAALLHYRRGMHEPERRAQAREVGDAHLLRAAANASAPPH